MGEECKTSNSISYLLSSIYRKQVKRESKKDYEEADSRIKDQKLEAHHSVDVD